MATELQSPPTPRQPAELPGGIAPPTKTELKRRARSVHPARLVERHSELPSQRQVVIDGTMERGHCPPPDGHGWASRRSGSSR